MSSQRLKRMADSVQRELSELIRFEIKDPRLGGLVTISAVKVSPDLGYADVYVTIMGKALTEQTEAVHQESLMVLNNAAGFLRQELGRRIKTRMTPRLRFHYDKTNAYGNYMFGLIAKAVQDLPPEEQTAQHNQN